jgi:hypothetical protein
MNSTVANEVSEGAAPKPLLETWGKNERIRHVPTIEWIVQKLEIDLRRRIGQLYESFTALPAGDSRWAAIEAEFRALCRSIDRLAEAARHGRVSNHAPAEIGARIDWEINHAISSLNSLDPTLFGRRYPFQAFERSKAEPIYGALLLVIDRVTRLTKIVRPIDPGIDERLLEGLVVLQSPLREAPMA